MIHRKPTLRETIQAALAGYTKELVVLPGWPQYCVTRGVLHCLVDDAETFSWMTPREKQWLIAYVQVAGPEPIEVAYDEAVQLYEEADALDRQASAAKPSHAFKR